MSKVQKGKLRTGIMSKIEDIKDNIGQIIVGKDETVLLTVVALVAGGHVLLEDVPEPAKQCLQRRSQDQ